MGVKEEPHSIMRSEEVMVIASSIKKPLSPRLELEHKLVTILPASFRVVARMNTGVTFLPSSLPSSTTPTVKFPDLVMLACNSLLHADVLDKNSADCRRVLELLAWILALTSTEKPKVPVILRPQEVPPRPQFLPPLVLPSWLNPRRPDGNFNTFEPSMYFSPT